MMPLLPDNLSPGSAAATGPAGTATRLAICPSSNGPPPIHRIVIFATATAASDIPGPPDFPAALLPLGTESFIERVFAELSDLGLREIDLVISDQPEALHSSLADGERWGITLRWHLAKTSSTPYALLRHIATGTQRVLIGHADHWISSALLASLQAEDAVAMDADTGQWGGWASLTGDALASIHVHDSMATLAAGICACQSVKQLQVSCGDHVFAGNATQLLAAQQMALSLDAASVPATWIRTAWGAMSPGACVSPKALMLGPVLVGSGCLINADARVGPNVVLASDVIVASNACVSNSVVMAGTFLDAGVELHGAVARGNLVQSVGRSAPIRVVDNKGSMLLHSDLEPVAMRWLGRTAAAAGLAVLLPWFLVDIVFCKLSGTHRRWRFCMAVSARPGLPLQLLELRTAPAGSTGYGHRAWIFGGLLDVVQGKRCWFGMRPRNTAEWEALSADWQRIFATVPIGLFHAPAWNDADPRVQLEAFAVADAYMAVRRSFWQRLRLCGTILVGSARPRQPTTAASRPPSLSMPGTQPFSG